MPGAAGPPQRQGQSSSTGSVHPPKNCSLGPPDLHVLIWRGPSSCPETEQALPMSLLSPSCWPGQAGDGFGAGGCYGDIWPALVLLLSVWEHCKLEIPEAINSPTMYIHPPASTNPLPSSPQAQVPTTMHSISSNTQLATTAVLGSSHHCGLDSPVPPHAVSTCLGGAGQHTKTCTE